MINFSSIVSAAHKGGQALRRRVWHPLRRMTEIFHILPLTAAILVFFLLATQPQLREIYLSYLEGLKNPTAGQMAFNVQIFLAGAAGLALISAALYEAHYWLSTMRINVVYSSLSDPESGSALRGLQRIAAIGLALVPWFAVVAGLFDAKRYLDLRYEQLCKARINPETINYLGTPGAGTIFISVLVLAVAIAWFLDRYRRSVILQSVTVIALPFAAIALFLLLTGLPVGALSGSRRVGILAIALGCAFYYLVYYLLYTMRTGWIYTQPTFPDTGINRRRRRRIALFLWAIVPCLLIGLYFVIDAMATSSPAFAQTPADLPAASRWAVIPVVMSWVIAAGLGVAMLLDHFRESGALPVAMGCILVVLVVVAGIMSNGSLDTMVWLYRLLGPLASAMLMLLFAVAALTLLALLSQKSGFPALTLVVLAIVVNAIFPVSIKITASMVTAVCLIFALMALLSRLWAAAAIALVLMAPGFLAWVQESRLVALNPNPGSGSDLKTQFKNWLERRPDAAAYAGRKYPVFIIAAEGGGIYAASAASLFLAKLEDANPGFSQHVFAISGVSGGAIGATVFQALMQSKFTSTGPHQGNAATPATPAETGSTSPPLKACAEPYKLHDEIPISPLAATVSRIMRDDHLSPVVGAIVPEFLGGAEVGRAEAVAGSFSSSVRDQNSEAGKALNRHFADHWSVESKAPALLLNSTWAETGFRVAFAPFTLHAHDDSLYSFSDENMPGNKAGNKAEDKEMSLIDAAVVSARFPGMLPPYSIMMNENGHPMPWNFVDGGYSDNSGASTALAIYRALKSNVENAEIKIILLTSSNPQPDLTPNKVSISGTTFRDTLAPITALLKVRHGLGNQAVARVCEEFQLRKDCEIDAANRDLPLRIVELEVEAYDLPLGWKLSHATFEMVRWMVGDAKLCASANAGVNTGGENRSSEEMEINERTVERNSCVHNWVAGLLAPTPAGQH